MEVETTEIARRAIAGDRGALEEIWRRHRRWLAAVVIAHAPAGDVDDLLQETAMVLVRSIQTLRDPARLRPWLRRVALNTVHTAARRRHRQQVGANGCVQRSSMTTPDELLQSECAGTLRAIAALPLIYREALLLQAVRGLTNGQIAETLELPVRTVETRLRRARSLMLDAATTNQPAIARQGTEE